MLTSLTAHGFKSWRSIGDVRLAPLTALFGANSSGKTSLLQVLLMLKQTADSADRSQVLNLGDDRSLVELGTFEEIIHGHDPIVPLDLGLEWTLPKPLQIEDPAKKGDVLFQSEKLGIYATIVWQRNGRSIGLALVDRMIYSLANATFGMQRAPTGAGKYELIQDAGNFQFVRTRGRPWELPPPEKCYGFPDQVRAYYQNAGFLSDLELKFEELLGSIFYLGPLREYPRRQYSWSGTRPSDMGRRGERVVDALLASREVGRSISRGQGASRQNLEERVATWLRDLGLISSFEVRSIKDGGQLFQVWVKRNPKAVPVLLPDVGFGVSQILPVIALCYYVPKGSILILEQPEIHLHPAVQSGLADVFIDAIKRRGIQIILESHSEHLLKRLQRRIAEEKLSADDAALYFCTTEKGESRLMPLKLNRFGSIENWPAGFFGDEFGELAATQDAIIDRQRKEAS